MGVMLMCSGAIAHAEPVPEDVDALVGTWVTEAEEIEFIGTSAGQLKVHGNEGEHFLWRTYIWDLERTRWQVFMQLGGDVDYANQLLVPTRVGVADKDLPEGYAIPQAEQPAPFRWRMVGDGELIEMVRQGSDQDEAAELRRWVAEDPDQFADHPPLPEPQAVPPDPQSPAARLRAAYADLDAYQAAWRLTGESHEGHVAIQHDVEMAFEREGPRVLVLAATYQHGGGQGLRFGRLMIFDGDAVHTTAIGAGAPGTLRTHKVERPLSVDLPLRSQAHPSLELPLLLEAAAPFASMMRWPAGFTVDLAAPDAEVAPDATAVLRILRDPEAQAPAQRQYIRVDPDTFLIEAASIDGMDYERQRVVTDEAIDADLFDPELQLQRLKELVESLEVDAP